MKPCPSIGLLRRGTGMPHVYMSVRVRWLGAEEGAGAGTGAMVGTEEGYRYGKKVRLVGTVSSTLLLIPYGVNRGSCADALTYQSVVAVQLYRSTLSCTDVRFSYLFEYVLMGSYLLCIPPKHFGSSGLLILLALFSFGHAQR